MPEYDENIEENNYVTFRECLSTIVIKQLATPVAKSSKKKSSKTAKKSGGRAAEKNKDGPLSGVSSVESMETGGNAEDLADFSEYLAYEIFPSLPADLRSLTYAAVRNDATLGAKYESPVPKSTLETLAALMPPMTLDSLTSYGLVSTHPDTPISTPAEAVSALLPFLKPLITAYTTAATAPPPSAVPLVSRSTQKCCEICERDWMPLTYHHLIPRSVHAKVIKRGWHEEWRLDSVAWLCRACHSFVHSLASNEELAREWWSVELLMERDDVRRWAGWVSRVRWKAR